MPSTLRGELHEGEAQRHCKYYSIPPIESWRKEKEAVANGVIVTVGLSADAPGKRWGRPITPHAQPRLTNIAGEQGRKRVWLAKKKNHNALVELMVTRPC